MSPDLIVWAVAGVSLLTLGTGVVWATRRAGAPEVSGGACGLDDLLMDIADAVGVTAAADAVYGHGCGIECDDLRLDALWLAYVDSFARSYLADDRDVRMRDGGGAA